MTNRAPLPIDDVLPRLGESTAKGNVVLSAPTGAGKTTRVPPFLADQRWSRGKRIVMLEPRRIAARAAGSRIAEERGVRLGDEVGYSVRFDHRASDSTRILVCTDGVFLRQLQSDPFLEDVAAVVFDEFHERSVNADLCAALVRQLQREARTDLRIVVMSATLETESIAAFLGGSDIVESKGRLFPVEVRHLGPSGPPNLRDLPRLVRNAVFDAADATNGDILVFLPGVGEIRRCDEDLSDLNDFAVVPLFGDLPLESQAAALRKGPRRKIVLATNVAETSVTVEGVTAVIDTGLARILRYDAGRGLDRLELSRISKASAEQRKGRAGRTAPGVCLRLWTPREESAMPHREMPEILRVDLAGPILQLRLWGESNPRAFPWFEAPPEPATIRAERLLVDLGAVDANGSLTALGRRIAHWPVHPRLARMMEAATEFGVLREASLAAALLSERDPFARTENRRANRTGVSDIAEKVAALSAFRHSGERFSDAGELVASSAKSVIRVSEQLEQTADRQQKRKPQEDGLCRSVFAAFADRLCRRRSPGGPRALMVGGRGVKLAEQTVVHDEELFVAVELASIVGSEDLVASASGVRRDWIDPSNLETVETAMFDPEKQRVVARRQTRFHDLILEESPLSNPNPTTIAAALAEAAAKDVRQSLALDRPEIVRLRARINWLRETLPEMEWPSVDDAAVSLLLPDLCIGRKSLAELREAPVAAAIENLLTQPQRMALHRDAPEKLEVPTGSRIALEYEPGKPPVLAVRLQEMFGMLETPRIAGGRVPVLLHLLAPNYRPQQVTQDLKSFWTNVYPKIRKELRMKYPKHSWPEDPFTAQPQRKGPSQKR
jgi:ATP-dependent helicase HrpB